MAAVWCFMLLQRQIFVVKATNNNSVMFYITTKVSSKKKSISFFISLYFSVLYKFVFFNHFFSCLFPNTNNIGFGKLVTLYLYFYEFIKNFTDLGIKKNKLYFIFYILLILSKFK